MTDFYEQIADLEAELDLLSDKAEQCRKSMIVAKVAMAAGTLLFAVTLFGFVPSDPVLLVIGIAAVLAGTAFLGSSRGTLEQVTGRIQVCEAHRAELIDSLDLRSAQDR